MGRYFQQEFDPDVSSRDYGVPEHKNTSTYDGTLENEIAYGALLEEEQREKEERILAKLDNHD